MSDFEECGVMGLCDKRKGHEGKHSTSVDRALAGVTLATPALDVERLARAIHGRGYTGSKIAAESWASDIAAEYAALEGDGAP